MLLGGHCQVRCIGMSGSHPVTSSLCVLGNASLHSSPQGKYTALGLLYVSDSRPQHATLTTLEFWMIEFFDKGHLEKWTLTVPGPSVGTGL